VVDEWGTWHKPGTELAPSHLLGQQSTLRDALVAGLTLDIFPRHADKVAMANVAQLVNCLQSLFFATGDRFVTTPTFDVFEMYGAHVGGRGVRSVFSAPRASYARVSGAGSLWGLAGSASLREKTLTLTVVNPHISEPREAEIAVRGAAPGSATVREITSADLRAHNTFERPKGLEPRDGKTPVGQGGIPDASVPAGVGLPPHHRPQLTLPIGG
jgi:alpha-N-arabinofuranosidase